MWSEPSNTFISTPLRISPINAAEKPARLSLTSKTTPASVERRRDRYPPLETPRVGHRGRLVCNLSGEPNVARGDGAERRRRYRTAPMRWRTGEVRYAMFGEPGKMVGDWLAGAREDQRGAAKDRAQ